MVPYRVFIHEMAATAAAVAEERRIAWEQAELCERAAEGKSG